MTQGSNTLHFYYDAQDKPCIVIFNGTAYGYLYNLQGDVVALVNGSGTKVVEYGYDAWGKPTSRTGTLANTLGKIQPFRYRGYVYDEETGDYYLRSRYYRPGWCRFVSADAISSVGYDLLGFNTYQYCGNNPVIRVDGDGFLWDTIFDVVSLCFSVGEVIANPTDVWSWVGLAGDIIDLVPFVTGVGETAKTVGATVRITNTIDNTCDTVRIVKAADFTDDVIDAIKTLDTVGKATRSTTFAGRKIHRGYKVGYELVEDMTKEAIKGKFRLDFLDNANHIIYELKPNNPRGIRDGIRQLQRYNDELGGGYTLILELYGDIK